MLTARTILASGQWSRDHAKDHVTLDYDNRHRRRIKLTSAGGISFLLDLPHATVLRDGDALLLSDGVFVEVRAAGEALMEISAANPALLLRLAWHIGNRHLPAELRGETIRLRDDHVIHAMLEGLGAHIIKITAPFMPESGAYAETHNTAHPGHHLDHSHTHEHAH